MEDFKVQRVVAEFAVVAPAGSSAIALAPAIAEAIKAVIPHGWAISGVTTSVSAPKAL